jgi:hypothetical protein
VRRRSISVVVWVVALAALATVWAAGAMGERSQSGNVVVSLSGEIRPHFLPRLRPVPVSIALSSDFSTADGGRLPQLRRISIAVGRRGRLGEAGLPACPIARVQVTTLRRALAECGPARVGFGHLSGEVTIPGQRSFSIDGRILAFNGRLKGGRTAVLADVHSKAPPVSFVMPFVLRRGAAGAVLTAKLPRAAGGWIHVDHFDLTLQRRYGYRGQRRSYLSARCAVPKGFTAIVFPLLQATYSFAGGHDVSAVAMRGCSVRR